ncbi:XRE family transcriptional regulator [Verminephrobacter aporrectodeae subsp. tuberculatae]|uniref:helix-turn-helix domain-containing protein n=1 Tax=Verminephrobacter aporrectodeae TaxID=1110389 RepID=UPI0022432F65|nr:helix-turn-helix transcriptional regulator [Verminephrobacter aporrectodeae]MCW8199279.1 XRE family transcriptional regulator [Verminephrobacter aporrectodeae subsp. tuberculatae]MCW8207650.1 XRE family transcriptional regulator [Verminephrobacter aporrectodeae subsp. tuberculatae]
MNFESLGIRLREVRKGLGKNQDEMAASCGVSREMWGKYERGIAMPGGEVLAKISLGGADVTYILTGQPAAGALSQDEAQLVTAFRASSPARQACMLEVSEALSAAPGPARKAGASIHVGGNVTQAIGGDASFSGDVRIGSATKR